ncbi:DUF2272 domain-containing protein [Enterobacter soli]|uniref:DUF2272 domain-containing protein n=1 Tax=Enterobacter soli TaxID=885040 RepID=UPI001C272760|nr:DUF2272 domain-containing protein [Enterobacter soli]
MCSDYVNKVVSTAISEHDTYSMYGEEQQPLRGRIETYYNNLGISFPGVSQPWSAIFVSWVMNINEGTNHTFPISTMHSFYFNRAIKNRLMNAGDFIGWDINEYAPSVGDIIQMNRGHNSFDYAYAANNMWYESHSAIVVKLTQKDGVPVAVVVGGNENVGTGPVSKGTIGVSGIQLNNDGYIIQRDINPYICIMQNKK